MALEKGTGAAGTSGLMRSMTDLLNLVGAPPPRCLPQLEARIDRGWKLRLDGMRRALDRLGWPAYPVILVGGTNGKGSVAAHLHRIFSDVGLRVGLTTSPHLVDVRERIRVGESCITANDFDRRFAEVAAVDDDDATYFETLALMAIRHFTAESVDMAVVEIGLGGRLDAFNALDPAVSIVVSIGLEHTQWLGDSLVSIAREKAAIGRPGRPMILGANLPELREAAMVTGAMIEMVTGPLGADYGEQDREIALAAARRAAVVPGIAERLRVPFTEQAARESMARTYWPGRFDVLRSGGCGRPEIILDAAHNPPAAAALEQRLRGDAAGRRVACVAAFLRDKDVAGIFAALGPVIDRWHITGVSHPRALPPGEAPIPGNATVHAQLAAAFMAAQFDAGADGVVLVCGSIYLLGEFLRWWRDDRYGSGSKSGGPG